MLLYKHRYTHITNRKKKNKGRDIFESLRFSADFFLHSVITVRNKEGLFLNSVSLSVHGLPQGTFPVQNPNRNPYASLRSGALNTKNSKTLTLERAHTKALPELYICMYVRYDMI